MPKYIFVTGGVVSSVGKGITVASLGRILKSRDISVCVQKLDPYLNVDPGTMSPYQHGEVFVTEDGGETDLDLGHYERFIDINLTKSSSVTTGQVYSSVISQERRGQFLGRTIQVIPHITEEIKQRIAQVGRESGAEVVIVEVGGTVGDIESQPFLEAIRQLHRELGPSSTLFVHVTLIPYISATGELKTKPTQHSVRELGAMGIQPDIIICRSDYPVNESLKDKLALFCGVERRAVIYLPTVETVYEVPLVLEEEGLGDLLIERLRLPAVSADLVQWRAMVEQIKRPKSHQIHVGIIGKYVDLPDAYISVREALRHAAAFHDVGLTINWIDSEQLEMGDPRHILRDLHGIVVPGGFGQRGIEGKIAAAGYARERKVPYLGLCLGMQVMVVELARAALGSSAPNSTEFDPATPYPVIDLLPEQRGVEDLGGTMRLGRYPCVMVPGTNVARAYRVELIYERHRHRFELNNDHRDLLTSAGLVISGLSPDGRLVEIVELTDHPWMVGCQFHPEFKSRPDRPHPLFREFVRACAEFLREGDQRPLPLKQVVD
ncbi:MAG: CTP synthase [Chloroflexi bacterium]|nr:CTP synthase [Chloroflexota bacterium]